MFFFRLSPEWEFCSMQVQAPNSLQILMPVKNVNCVREKKIWLILRHFTYIYNLGIISQWISNKYFQKCLIYLETSPSALPCNVWSSFPSPRILVTEVHVFHVWKTLSALVCYVGPACIGTYKYWRLSQYDVVTVQILLLNLGFKFADNFFLQFSNILCPWNIIRH
jgi:hypothetical protein